ncbi:hypothetical protein [Candidatus Nitrotoga sp. BS]|uniref:hypothetical protein n=1 Tax=Candidatus Nitrotoga sp. BS TaxID=2890408 RepID=UPI00403DA6CB
MACSHCFVARAGEMGRSIEWGNDALCLQVTAGKAAFINHYATTPAEFFAVLSEYVYGTRYF